MSCAKRREPQDAGHVGRPPRDPLPLGQFCHGGELARFEHPLPAEGAGQRLHQRAVRPPRRRRSIGQPHLLPPAALHDAERDVERHRLGGGRPAGSRGALHARRPASRARGWPRPSNAEPHVQAVRADVDPLDSSATMRACSAGKSSSHSGSSCCRAARTSAALMSPSCARAAFNVPATISGWTEHSAQLVDYGRLDFTPRARGRPGTTPRRASAPSG